MAKQKFGLGRGLDALISGASEVMAPQQPQPSVSDHTETLPLVALESITPNPRQPRRSLNMDDPRLLELSASIKEHGLLQPLVVTRLPAPDPVTRTPGVIRESSGWFGDEESAAQETPASAAPAAQYQIIAGERRWHAARLAGLDKVPVVIKEVTPQQMLELALIENIQRADLNPIEEALAYQALIEEYGLTQEMVARRVGKDRSTITNSLRLLQLAPEVREALTNQSRHFTEGHARALVGIEKAADQIQAMKQIIALELNVRQTEDLAARLKASQNVEEAIQQVSPPPARQPELLDLEKHFRDALMVKVDLKYNVKGKGTLVLHFNDQEELESLYNRLVKHNE